MLILQLVGLNISCSGVHVVTCKDVNSGGRSTIGSHHSRDTLLGSKFAEEYKYGYDSLVE